MRYPVQLHWRFDYMLFIVGTTPITTCLRRANGSVIARQPQRQPVNVPSINKQAFTISVLVKDTPPLSSVNVFHVDWAVNKETLIVLLEPK